MGRGEGYVCRCGKRYWKEIMELAVAVRMRRRRGEQIRSSRCIQLVTIRHQFNSLFWRTHKKLLLVRFHQPVTICNRLLCGCLEIPNNHFLACSFFYWVLLPFCEKKGASYVWDGCWGESSFGLNYLEIPDGCSILSAIYILRGMYMKCHFYVHRHLNLLGMFSIWCSCCKFCNNCWGLLSNLSECPTSWTLQQLSILICPISYLRHKCKNGIYTFTLLFAITYSPTR